MAKSELEKYKLHYEYYDKPIHIDVEKYFPTFKKWFNKIKEIL